MKQLLSIIVIVGYVISLTGCITGSGVIKGDDETSLSLGEGQENWIAEGHGNSKESAIFEAKCSAIKQALKKIVGTEATEQIDLIKKSSHSPAFSGNYWDGTLTE